MLENFIKLGVNIDHVATLRQARGERYPDPIYAAQIAQENGADGITLHLREDRRHIQERDVKLLAELLQIPMNLEMAVAPEILAIAEEVAPQACCLVPEKREELTTEGGLDVLANLPKIKTAVERLHAVGSEVSLFIDPDKNQIDAACEVGARVIEIHTGTYAQAKRAETRHRELEFIVGAVDYAASIGLRVNAGHGLNYHNVEAIAAILSIRELNIGHSIIAQSLFSGLAGAVRHMKDLMVSARQQSIMQRGVHHG